MSFFLSEDEYTRKKGEGESGKIKCKNFFFILITLHVLFALGLQTLLKGTKNWFIVLCAGIAFSSQGITLGIFFSFCYLHFFWK